MSEGWCSRWWQGRLDVGSGSINVHEAMLWFKVTGLSWNTYIVIKATHWTMSNFRQVSRVCTDVTKEPHPAWPAWKSAIRIKYLKVAVWRRCFLPFSGWTTFFYWLPFIFISAIQPQIEFNFPPSLMVREMILIQLTLLNRRQTLFSNQKSHCIASNI